MSVDSKMLLIAAVAASAMPSPRRLALRNDKAFDQLFSDDQCAGNVVITIEYAGPYGDVDRLDSIDLKPHDFVDRFVGRRPALPHELRYAHPTRGWWDGPNRESRQAVHTRVPRVLGSNMARKSR